MRRDASNQNDPLRVWFETIKLTSKCLSERKKNIIFNYLILKFKQSNVINNNMGLLPNVINTTFNQKHVSISIYFYFYIVKQIPNYTMHIFVITHFIITCIHVTAALKVSP